MQSNSTYFPTFFENFTLIKSLAWSKLCQRDYNPYVFVQYQVFHKIPPIATLTVITLPVFQRIFQQLRYFIFICNFFHVVFFATKSVLARSLKNVYCGKLNRTGRLTNGSALVGSRKCSLLFLFHDSNDAWGKMTQTRLVFSSQHRKPHFFPKPARTLKETTEFNASRGISSHSSHVCWALSAYKLSASFSFLFFFAQINLSVTLSETAQNIFVIFCEFSTHWYLCTSIKYGKCGILQKVKFVKTDNYVMSRRERNLNCVIMSSKTVCAPSLCSRSGSATEKCFAATRITRDHPRLFLFRHVWTCSEMVPLTLRIKCGWIKIAKTKAMI